VLRLRRYERISIENWRFRSNAVTLTKNCRYSVEGVALPTILLVSKTMINVFFMRYKNVGTSFFRFVTNHMFDSRRDGLAALS